MKQKQTFETIGILLCIGSTIMASYAIGREMSILLTAAILAGAFGAAFILVAMRIKPAVEYTIVACEDHCLDPVLYLAARYEHQPPFKFPEQIKHENYNWSFSHQVDPCTAIYSRLSPVEP